MGWNLVLALIAFFAPASPGSSAGYPVVPVVDSIEVAGFAPRHSTFEVRFGDLPSGYRTMAMFALPGQRVPIEVRDSSDAAVVAGYELHAEAGATRAEGINRWTWVAPAGPGLCPIQIWNARDGSSMTLNVFVMVPYTAMRRGALNGYRIGAYPRPQAGHAAEYERPLGFVEVTPELLSTLVSPHFTLGQFVCKQAGDYPLYLVLRQPLLVKLEQLLAAVNDRGIAARTFSIMSAYRTPFYNAAIGNVTIFSRHEYGDAADVFVDDDGDGVMDDLNHDGRHTIADARLLGAIVNGIEAEPEFARLVGGLGTYGPTSEHGAFLHVDARGFSVEWSA